MNKENLPCDLWCIRRPARMARILYGAQMPFENRYWQQARKAWNLHELKDWHDKPKNGESTWMQANVAIALLHLCGLKSENMVSDGDHLMRDIYAYYKISEANPQVELGNYYPDYLEGLTVLEFKQPINVATELNQVLDSVLRRQPTTAATVAA